MKGECGHPVTFIIGRFALCSVRGCDTKPGERCQRCGSRDLYVFEASHLPNGTLACRNCGGLRWTY